MGGVTLLRAHIRKDGGARTREDLRLRTGRQGWHSIAWELITPERRSEEPRVWAAPEFLRSKLGPRCCRRSRIFGSGRLHAENNARAKKTTKRLNFDSGISGLVGGRAIVFPYKKKTHYAGRRVWWGAKGRGDRGARQNCDSFSMPMK